MMRPVLCAPGGFCLAALFHYHHLLYVKTRRLPCGVHFPSSPELPIVQLITREHDLIGRAPEPEASRLV